MATFLAWFTKKKIKDPDNIFPPGLSYKKAVSFLHDYLLGEDWYVNYSCSGRQACTEITWAILEKYSRKFRKELKKFRKEMAKK